METKLEQKRLVEQLDIRTPRLLQGPFASCAQFDLAKLPKRFVIKPNWGAEGVGVLILETNEGKVVDLKNR